VASDLRLRDSGDQENRSLCKGLPSNFTRQYCVYILYVEFHETVENAILREKQIKKWKWRRA